LLKGQCQETMLKPIVKKRAVLTNSALNN
jgi:hypothetical protein